MAHVGVGNTYDVRLTIALSTLLIPTLADECKICL
jgi:hypothetical protein